MKRMSVLALAIVFILSGFAGCRQNTAVPEETQDDEYEYYFSLEDMDGETWALDQLEGDVLVLYFWSASCFPCLARLKDLNQLAGEMPEGSHLLLVNLNDRRDTIQHHTEKYENLTVLQSGFNLFRRLGLRATPSLAVFDRRGKLFDRQIGFPDNSEVLAIVERAR